MIRQELLKNAKPILFNTEMVRAILEGRKTVTRRVIKTKFRDDEYGFIVWYNEKTGNYVVEKYDEDEGSFCPTRYVNPPYRKGDILYVRETFCTYCADHVIDGVRYAYKADATPESERVRKEYCYKYRPSIHMPKGAARIFLKVTDVRVERLQEITTDECRNEGCCSSDCLQTGRHSDECKCDTRFINTWNSTIKKQDIDKYSWQANPWVWVYKFERIEI